VLAEAESNCKLIAIKSNRGGEYTSNAFQDFCRKNGIRHQLIVAYSPQQNGIAERKNRTILDMTRSKLKERIAEAILGESHSMLGVFVEPVPNKKC
jgi:transposase InsO family protein